MAGAVTRTDRSGSMSCIRTPPTCTTIAGVTRYLTPATAGLPSTLTALRALVDGTIDVRSLPFDNFSATATGSAAPVSGAGAQKSGVLHPAREGTHRLWHDSWRRRRDPGRRRKRRPVQLRRGSAPCRSVHSECGPEQSRRRHAARSPQSQAREFRSRPRPLSTVSPWNEPPSAVGHHGPGEPAPPLIGPGETRPGVVVPCAGED
eukprot:scaffold2375_cov107-Isochrysis_galbana.AAC.9